MENKINMFEVAVRNKLRFEYKGNITVEDLWDLNVNELDKIYKNLKSKVKQSQEESLLKEKTKEDNILNTKIEIVTHIVKVKLQEIEDKKNELQKKELKQKLLKIKEQKENEGLNNLSIEEIEAKLKELD